MGYPMTYRRVVSRNWLTGDYHLTPNTFEPHTKRSVVAGDLRRLESDQRDDYHVSEYAKRAGCTVEQAKAVLDAFFDGDF